MLVTEKGDELYNFTGTQSTTPETSENYDLATVHPGILNSFNLDMDCDITSSEDFLHELSNDLEIPMLLEESHHFKEDCLLESSSFLDSFNDWGNDSTCDIDIISPICDVKDEIKIEPGSPFSPSSLDSWQSSDKESKKVVLETPPISPPEMLDGSPPRSPTLITQAKPTKVKITEKPVILCNGSNGTIRILPYNSNYNNINNNNNNNNNHNNKKCVKLEGSKGRKLVLASNNGTKILNVQPHLVTTSVTTPAITLPNDVNGRRRVLVTAKDISALTQQNNKINSNSINTTSQQPVIPVIANQTAPTQIKIETPSKMIPVSVRREMQLRVLKRQQRMIKNRESACLSRKKKKEYVSSLETKIVDLEKENFELKRENAALKERLSELETSVCKPKSNFQPNVKKTSVLLAMLLILSVNLGSISLMKRPAPELSTLNDVSSTRHHYSRTLLWENSDISDGPTIINASSGFPHNPLTCPLYINQTESLRLNSELRKWIGVDEEGRATNMNEVNSAKVEASSGEVKKLRQLMLPTKFPPSPPPPQQQQRQQPPKNVTRPRRKPRMQRKVFHEVELIGTQVERTGLLQAIRRRDDTFYVVSFSGDHLLLPALAHNNTLRPKMSLVLPALPFNGSLNTDEPLTMMQIDCEVLDTRLVELKETDIPANFRNARHSSQTAQNVTDSVAVRQQPYRPYFMRSSSSPESVRSEAFNSYASSLYHTRARPRSAFP